MVLGNYQGISAIYDDELSLVILAVQTQGSISRNVSVCLSVIKPLKIFRNQFILITRKIIRLIVDLNCLVK